MRDRRHTVCIRLSALERYEFEQVAKAVQLPASAMIRQAVRALGRELGLHFGPNPADPTSCPDCGIAAGCDHAPGCPQGDK